MLTVYLRNNQKPRLIYGAGRDLDPIRVFPHGLRPFEVDTVLSLVGSALRLIVLEFHKV